MSAPLIDRLVAPFGARTLVATRPGGGWLLTEVIPPVAGNQIIGSVSMDGFYLVTLLVLLGASERTLAALPIIAYLGAALGAGLAFLHPRADPRLACLWHTWLGRGFWQLAILAMIAVPALGGGIEATIGAVLGAIFLGQIFLLGGVTCFVAWTRDLIPGELRGRFYAWRNVASMIAAIIAMQAIAWAYPSQAAPDQQKSWLITCFAIVSGAILLSTWILAQVPPSPTATGIPPSHGTARRAVRLPGTRRLLAWNAINVAASAIVLPVLPLWLKHCGVDPARMATAQSAAFFPAMLAGILIGGRYWNRLGGATVFLFTAVGLALGDAAMLLLSPERNGWLLFACLAFSGLGKGLASVSFIVRLQEVAPDAGLRLPAIALCLGGLSGALAGGVLLAGHDVFAGWHATLGCILPLSWFILAGAALLRLGNIAVALPPRP
jgi:hypothetical protein